MGRALDFPWAIRWGLGFGLIVLGNAIIWSGVMQLGIAATSGGEGVLRTRGLYRLSRNPQYVADMAILIGIGLFSASILSWPVIITGTTALALATFGSVIKCMVRRYAQNWQTIVERLHKLTCSPETSANWGWSVPIKGDRR